MGIATRHATVIAIIVAVIAFFASASGGNLLQGAVAALSRNSVKIPRVRPDAFVQTNAGAPVA
jgi:hypothetical protein